MVGCPGRVGAKWHTDNTGPRADRCRGNDCKQHPAVNERAGSLVSSVLFKRSRIYPE